MEEVKTKKKLKKWQLGLIIGVSAAIVLTGGTLIGLTFGGGSYFYNYALNPAQDEAGDLGSTNKDEIFSKLDPATKVWYDETVVNWYDANFVDTDANALTIPSTYDDITLAGYKLMQEEINSTHNYVILVHGYRSSPEGMSHIAYEYFNTKKFNVVLPWNRGHGKTYQLNPDTYISMGWLDHYDVLDWADYIKKEDPLANIVLHGVSMGGATVMMASGETERLEKANVTSIIEDCGYTSIGEQFGYVATHDVGLISTFPFLDGLNFYVKKNQGFDIFKDTSLKMLKQSTIPMMFIHGKEDDFVPYFMLDKNVEAYLSANDNNKNQYKVLTFNDCLHGYASIVGYKPYKETNNPNYFDEVFNFVDQYTK